jgi:hypothetical protein
VEQFEEQFSNRKDPLAAVALEESDTAVADDDEEEGADDKDGDSAEAADSSSGPEEALYTAWTTPASPDGTITSASPGSATGSRRRRGRCGC